MSRKYSPFAGLDARERQERWLEYQNTHMPYIQGAMDMEEEPVEQPVAERGAARDAQRMPVRSPIPSSAPTAAYAMQQQHPQRPTSPAQRMRNPAEPVYASQPPPQQQPQARQPQPNPSACSQEDAQAAQSMKVVRHRQYDAVIRKMMDAEKQAKSFQDWSPRV